MLHGQQSWRFNEGLRLYNITSWRSQHCLDFLQHASSAVVTGVRVGSIARPCLQRPYWMRQNVTSIFSKSPELEMPSPDTRLCSKVSPKRSKAPKFILKRLENSSVPKPATLSAKDMKYVSIKDAGMCHGGKALKGKAMNKKASLTAKKTQERTQGPQYSSTFFVSKGKKNVGPRASAFSPQTNKQDDRSIKKSVCPQASNFFTQANKQDGRLIKKLSPSLSQALSKAPSDLFGVRKKFEAEREVEIIYDSRLPRPCSNARPSSPRDLGAGSGSDSGDSGKRIGEPVSSIEVSQSMEVQRSSVVPLCTSSKRPYWMRHRVKSMYPNSLELLVPNPDTRPCSKASPKRSKVAKYTLKHLENPSVHNAATLSAKDMKHASIKDAGVCHGMKTLFDKGTSKQTNLAGQRTQEMFVKQGPQCSSIFLVSKGKESVGPQSSTFFTQTNTQEGRPTENVSPSLSQALFEAPNDSIFVRKEFQTNPKFMNICSSLSPRPWLSVRPSSPRELCTGLERDSNKRREGDISLTQTSLVGLRKEVAAPEPSVVRQSYFVKSQQSISSGPPSRHVIDVVPKPTSCSERPKDVVQKGNQKMVKQLKGDFDPVVPSVNNHYSSTTCTVNNHPLGRLQTAPTQEGASGSSNSGFSREIPKSEVFVKQRRDVQLMDAELRPVGHDAPLGFGSLVSTDCQTLGILRLQPGVAKSSSKSLDHDVILLATDNTVLVKGTSTWELLTKNSCCHISKGVPYSVLNISHAPAEVCFIVGGPC